MITATLEIPPQPEEEGYAEFKHAYKAFLDANSQRMKVPVLAPKVLQELDRPRAENKFTPIKEQPAYLVGGKLMPFQLDGVNFLFLCVVSPGASLLARSQKLTYFFLCSSQPMVEANGMYSRRRDGECHRPYRAGSPS